MLPEKLFSLLALPPASESQGVCLALAARREDRLQQVAQVARELGSPDVIVIAADVSRIDDCKHMVDQTVNHFGKLDHLVNNAGIFVSVSMFEEVDITVFRSVMASKAAVAQLFETLRIEFGSAIKAQVGSTPVMSAAECCKAIMKSACRGDRYLMEPAWIRITRWLKLSCPEILDIVLRLFYISKAGASAHESFNKWTVDLIRYHKVFYRVADVMGKMNSY
ncbi:hypothetical protein AgCh_021020 [Apium graveolens]